MSGLHPGSIVSDQNLDLDLQDETAVPPKVALLTFQVNQEPPKVGGF